MKHNILIFTLFLFAAFCHAEQPQWELFFPDISGPIAVDPTNSDVIYITGDSCYNCGTTGMWKTIDGGQTWNYYGEGWFMGNPEDILVYPHNPDVILVGGGPFVGVLRSTNGGQSWEHADSGFVVDHHGYLIRDLAYDNKNKAFYAADNGTFGGVFRSTDGIHWQRMSSDFIPWKYFIDEENDVLYASSWGPGVSKSVDAGSSWVNINNGLPGDPPNVFDIAKVKSSQTLYAATRYGIYKSLDGGENWFSVNDSLTKQLSFRGGLVISETDTSTVFAGAEAVLDSTKPELDPTRPGGIYHSRDSGQSWQLGRFGVPNSVINFWVNNIYLDNKQNMLYASISLIFSKDHWESGIYRLPFSEITYLEKSYNSDYKATIAVKGFPNPFNSQTTLAYSVQNSGRVIIKIFNTLGKEVITLLDEIKVPGEHLISWDGRNRAGKIIPTGIYFARIQLGKNFNTIKLLNLK